MLHKEVKGWKFKDTDPKSEHAYKTDEPVFDCIHQSLISLLQFHFIVLSLISIIKYASVLWWYVDINVCLFDCGDMHDVGLSQEFTWKYNILYCPRNNSNK